MMTIYLHTTDHGKLRITEVCSPVNGNQLMIKVIEEFGIKNNHFFFKSNGRLVEPNDILHNGDVFLEPKLCGGKGGFGSMLRAIGAQIEKTTNREACRDLSGRRLRDINEEKRLKAWIEKQSKRDEEAVERKKRKLAKLCAEPKHEFKDKDYEQQRTDLTERVEDAVEVGFAAVSSVGIKRAAAQEAGKNLKKRKTILDLDDDINSDDLESSDDSSDEKESVKKETVTNNKLDSENSSDATTSSSEKKIQSTTAHVDDSSR